MERGGSIAARTGPLHFSVFFASVGIAYVYLIPAYAEQLGAGYLDLGLIGTVRSLPYTFLPVIAGYLGDRLGRRRLYLQSIFAVGYATYCLLQQGRSRVYSPSKWSWGFGLSLFWPISEALVS